MLPHLYFNRVLSSKYTKMFSWFIQNTYNKLLKWDEIDFEKNEKGIKKSNVHRLVKQKAITRMKEKKRIKVHIFWIQYALWHTKCENWMLPNWKGRWRRVEDIAQYDLYVFNVHIFIWNQFPVLLLSNKRDGVCLCVCAVCAGNTKNMYMLLIYSYRYKAKVIAYLWWWIFFMVLF